MTKIWRSHFKDDGQRQLIEVAPDQLQIDRPTVVFFSGFDTTTKNKHHVAGALKRLEKAVGQERKNDRSSNLFVVSYSGLRESFNAIVYNCFPWLYHSKGAKHIARTCVLPLVADCVTRKRNGDLKSGKKLPIEEAARRLRSLTFMGYSMGTVFAQEVYNASRSMMRKLGYSKKETEALLQEIVLLSVGNISRPLIEKNRFTTVYLAATNDDLIQHKNLLWFSWAENAWNRFNSKKKLQIRNIGDNGFYISAPVRVTIVEEILCSKTGEKIRKQFGNRFFAWTGLFSHHELPHYVTSNDADNAFAKIASFTLLNAMARDQKMTVEQLITPTEHALSALGIANNTDEVEKYMERIRSARKDKAPKQAAVKPR